MTDAAVTVVVEWEGGTDGASPAPASGAVVLSSLLPDWILMPRPGNNARYTL